VRRIARHAAARARSRAALLPAARRPRRVGSGLGWPEAAPARREAASSGRGCARAVRVAARVAAPRRAPSTPPLHPPLLLPPSGYYRCEPAVKVGRPTTFAELTALVAAYPRVQAVGVGHSWNQPRFCAGTDGSALNLVLTEFPSVLKSYTQTPDDYKLAEFSPPLGYDKFSSPWSLDRNASTVTALAGVGTRALLDWLAVQKPGLTLAAFPWYIDQTIGGAVATATHGSSLRFGSLSQQVTAIQLVLGDGSARTLTPADGFLFDAATASVGRAGVITQLTLRVVPSVPVERAVVKETWDDMVAEVSAAANGWVAATTAGNAAAASAALSPLDEVDYFMYIPLRKAWKVNYTRLAGDADGKAATVRDAVQQVKVEQAAALKAVRAAMAAAKGEPAAAALDALIAEKEAAAAWLAPAANASRGVVPGWPTLDTVAVSALPGHHLGLSHVALDAQVYGVAAALDAKTKGSNPPGAYDQWPKAVAVPPAPLYKYDWFDHKTWSAVFSGAMAANLAPGVYAARAAYASQSAVPSVLLADMNPYDQYEAAIPISRAAGCLAAVTDVLYGPAQARTGFRTTPLLRFSSPDAALISPANWGPGSVEPTMYFNLEDHVSYATPGEANAGFQAVVSTLVKNPACAGRLHWGKAGWPTQFPCYDGNAVDGGYPGTWCQFGCAVAALDPAAKFESTFAGWSFNAVLAGGSTPATNFAAQCCTGAGGAFDSGACTCAARPPC